MPREEYWDALFDKRPKVIKPGLDRIRLAWDALGREGAEIPAILVGGTNGKGSTAGFLWHLLAVLGTPAALFSSPHLVHFRERFQLTHRPVREEDLRLEADALRRELGESHWEDLSFFEVTTLMALRFFRRQGSCLNILEVGLGGRWDSTNVVDPIASAIVSIGRDHMAFLGDTLALIAREKAGIMRAGKPAFGGLIPSVGLSPDEDAYGVLRAHAGAIGACWWSRPDTFSLGPDKTSFQISLPGIPSYSAALPRDLGGAALYLRENFVLASAILWWLLNTRPQALALGVEEDSPEGWMGRALMGFGRAGLPVPWTLWGRAQRRRVTFGEDSSFNRQVLFDVCHNVEGVEALRRALDQASGDTRAGGGTRPALISILRDKPVNEMLDLMRRFLNPIVLFKIENDRSFCREDLAPRHRDLPLYESLEEACRAAWADQRADEARPWVLCGSVAAVGFAMRFLGAYTSEISLGDLLRGDASLANGNH
jgi:dihydrofolate synthase/folylpolyglutamate synthase